MRVQSTSYNSVSVGKNPPLTGERALLRPLQEGDLEKREALLRDPFWHRMHGSTGMVSLDDTAIRRANKELLAQPYTWAIERGEICIGVICLSGFRPPLAMSGMLGIDIFEEKDRGQGNGSDALQVLMRYAFKQLKLQWLKLEVHQNNPVARLYRRLGFVNLGVSQPDRPKMQIMTLPAHKFFASQAQP